MGEDRKDPLELAKAVEKASASYNEGDVTSEKVEVSKTTAKALYEHIWQHPADFWSLDDHYRVAAALAHRWVRAGEEHSSETIAKYYERVNDVAPPDKLMFDGEVLTIDPKEALKGRLVVIGENGGPTVPNPVDANGVLREEPHPLSGETKKSLEEKAAEYQKAIDADPMYGTRDTKWWEKVLIRAQMAAQDVAKAWRNGIREELNSEMWTEQDEAKYLKKWRKDHDITAEERQRNSPEYQRMVGAWAIAEADRTMAKDARQVSPDRYAERHLTVDRSYSSYIKQPNPGQEYMKSLQANVEKEQPQQQPEHIPYRGIDRGGR